MDVNPDVLLFTQDSIKNRFKEPREHERIDDAVDSLLQGKVKASDFPRLNVVSFDGQLWSLDNRRLWVFKKARVPSITVNLVSYYSNPRMSSLIEQNPTLKAAILKPGYWPRVRGRCRTEFHSPALSYCPVPPTPKLLMVNRFPIIRPDVHVGLNRIKPHPTSEPKESVALKTTIVTHGHDHGTEGRHNCLTVLHPPAKSYCPLPADLPEGGSIDRGQIYRKLKGAVYLDPQSRVSSESGSISLVPPMDGPDANVGQNRFEGLLADPQSRVSSESGSLVPPMDGSKANVGQNRFEGHETGGPDESVENIALDNSRRHLLLLIGLTVAVLVLTRADFGSAEDNKLLMVLKVTSGQEILTIVGSNLRTVVDSVIGVLVGIPYPSSWALSQAIPTKGSLAVYFCRAVFSIVWRVLNVAIFRILRTITSWTFRLISLLGRRLLWRQ